MNLPTIAHPTVFDIGGHRIQLLTHFVVSRDQAALIVLMCFRQRRWLKKDLGKTTTIAWPGDRAALALLEAAADDSREALSSLTVVRATPSRPARR